MQYFTLQIKYTSLGEEKKIITDVTSKKDFEKFIENRGNFVVNTSDSIECLKDRKYEPGKYILYDYSKMVAVRAEKQEKELTGYIYNSKKTEVILLTKWELIPTEKSKLDFEPKTFNLMNMISFPSIAIIGRDREFRSKMVTNILDKYKPKIISNSLAIVSKEENNQPLYSNKFKNLNVINDYNSKLVKQFTNNTKEGVILFDMSGYYNRLRIDGKWVAYNDLSNLIFQGRHYKKTIVILCEDPFDIPMEFRANLQYIFSYSRVKHFSPDSNNLLLEKYYKSLFLNSNLFNDVNQFKEIVNEIMDNRFITVFTKVYYKNKKDLQSSVFKYKVKM